MHNTPTITAIATAQGQAAIACIRVSGEDAFTVCDKIFRNRAGKQLSTQKGNTLLYGEITDAQQNTVDEVLAAVFTAPHSFTGENTVELFCHGSVYIQQQVLQLLLAAGAQLAQPGEFTLRAFMNGKLDLSQAEAVADLIASQSQAAHRMAMQQMRGGFSTELNNLREQLLHFIALVELELDFSEEEVEFADRTALRSLVNRILEEVKRLKDSFSLGNAIKNGIPVAIVGNTNVGKSTLLNALLNEERALVSDIHGTTRDAIEDTVTLQGYTFRFIDTAGIRHTTDTVENMGITRTFDKLQQADIVLLLLDATTPEANEPIIAQIREKIDLSKQRWIIALNKIDKLPKNHPLPQVPEAVVLGISAKQKLHLTNLVNQLVASVSRLETNPNETIVSNARHYEALTLAYHALQEARQGLDMQLSGELLSQSIREAIEHLGSITGQIGSQDVLNHIFSKFCIGK